MSPARDDHEDTRREQAASIAEIEATIRALGNDAIRDRELIKDQQDHIRRHGRELGEIQIARTKAEGRLDSLEDAQEKGSERMQRIETDVRELRDGQATIRADARVAARTVAIYLAVAMGALQLVLWGVGLWVASWK